MIHFEEGPAVNVALPGASEDRRAYARVCGHVIVQTSRLLNLAEGVSGMTFVALRVCERNAVQKDLRQKMEAIRSLRREDVGFRRMDRSAVDDLIPPVQVRIPKPFHDFFEEASADKLAWLHMERRMTFKEFVKLTMLVGDQILDTSDRARTFIRSAWPQRP